MTRLLPAVILLVPLLAACTAGPTSTRVGVSTGTVIDGTSARVGASTAGRGVHVGVGLGRIIR